MARTYKRDSRGRFASGGGSGGSGGGKKRGAPKTTSARGRALTNQRRATEAVRAGRGGSGPSKKAVRSAVTAMRARAYYASTGTGTKRSAKRAVSAAKKGKAIRAESRAKGKAAGERAAGRPKARVVAGKAKSVAPATASTKGASRKTRRASMPAATASQRNMKAYLDQDRGRERDALRYAANDLRVKLPKKLRELTGSTTVGGALRAFATKSYQRGFSKDGLNTSERKTINDIVSASGAYGGKIKGVKLLQDGRGNWQLHMDGITKRQAEIGEKAGSRKPRRRKRS